MDRLGIFIFYLFFFGICFFERARTRGETGGLHRVLWRNFTVALFAVVAFFLVGIDIMFPAVGEGGGLFSTAKSIINYRDIDGNITPGARFSEFMLIWLDCLFCATATLIVAAGIWDLRIRAWSKWLLVAVFCLAVYPVFGLARGGTGFLGKLDSYDHAGALLVWALPGCYVLGARLFMPSSVLPDERSYVGLKGYQGIKHRFFFARGFGFTMIFLVLSASTLVNLPVQTSSSKLLWILSKTLTLIPASFTMFFCNFLFFGLFGRKGSERVAYAPPFFALMAALVATQACNQYSIQQAIIASIATTFTALLFLRVAPLRVRLWDPMCSVPVFIIGGFMGAIMASLTDAAQPMPQLVSIAVCLIFGLGVGAALTAALRQYRGMEPVEETGLAVLEEDGGEITAPDTDP